MDGRLKNIIDNFDSIKIGVDDSFKFHCNMCGKCCINREDILLSPKDLFNISKELSLSPQETVEKYCETYIGQDSRVPIVRLGPRGEIKRCPLLKDHKCSVHRAKPVVCAMFPVGRCLVLKNNKLDEIDYEKVEIQYILNNLSCGDDSETHTVREWLSAFGIPVDDPYFRQWQQMNMGMGTLFRKIEKKIGDHAMNMVWSAAFGILYLNYKIEKDFQSQFDENCREARKFFDLIKRTRGGEKDE